MHAKRLDSDFYEVTEGDKWWTAKRQANFGDPYWFITNHRGTVVASDGRTGKRIIAAISTLGGGR